MTYINHTTPVSYSFQRQLPVNTPITLPDTNYNSLISNASQGVKASIPNYQYATAYPAVNSNTYKPATLPSSTNHPDKSKTNGMWMWPAIATMIF